MKNTFGNHITLTLFGESHGKGIGVVIDGLAPGIEIDEEFIRNRLAARSGDPEISTGRRESDGFSFISGVYNGKTCGTPLCILIPNSDTKSRDYEKTRCLARPGHADYTAWCKYHGFEDFRGGGHFSGRLTAPLTAAGAIFISALKKKGIVIGTHIKKLGDIKDRDFDNYGNDIALIYKNGFPVLDQEVGKKMRDLILSVSEEGDSIGGILESAAVNLPAGVGEPWFDTLEGMLSHALFSIPAVKGVEFGGGFEAVTGRGSEFNDAFFIDEGSSADTDPYGPAAGRTVIRTGTNNNGGINGGISNGMPIIVRCAVKPTPSIYKEQDTVNFAERKNAKIKIEGRHDPAIIHRAAVVCDSMIAFVLCDMLTERLGTDYLA